MRGWGFTLLLIGAGSFILPMLGVQFILISIFGPYQEMAGVGMAVLGIVMIGASFATGEGSDDSSSDDSSSDDDSSNGDSDDASGR